MGNSPSRSDTHLSVSEKHRHNGRRSNPQSRSSSISRCRNGSGRLSIIATSGAPNTRRSHSATPVDRMGPPPPYSRSGSYSRESNTPSSSASPVGEMSMSWSENEARESYNKQISLATSSILQQFDTVIIMDDSSSMLQGGRWEEADRALSDLADFAGKYDSDGIDIHFLNDKRVGENIKNSAQVRELFTQIKPAGVTNIGGVLEKLITEYLDQLDDAEKTGGKEAMRKIKPVNYIVITDGDATDDPESVIVQAARRLDDKYRSMTQVGIQFVQIGPLQSAARFLARLDDALSTKHKIRDIVDTTRYSGRRLNAEMLIKILVGGINRRVDAEGGKVFRSDVESGI